MVCHSSFISETFDAIIVLPGLGNQKSHHRKAAERSAAKWPKPLIANDFDVIDNAN